MNTDDGVPGPWVEAWLSEPRFSAYRAAAGGDRRLALAVYEWNSAIGAAFHRDLAHLEVALRNAYDAAITARTPAELTHWTSDPYRLFPPRWRTARDGARIDANRTPREQLGQAARAAGPDAPPGKVIAELTFGFWRYMSIANRHHSLWIPYLHAAFAPGTARRAVDEPIGRLHQLRNRVAHAEPLLHRDTATRVLGLSTRHLIARHDDLLRVAEMISPRLHDHIMSVSTTRSCLDHPPR